jgi:hypothetical protein
MQFPKSKIRELNVKGVVEKISKTQLIYIKEPIIKTAILRSFIKKIKLTENCLLRAKTKL